MSIMTETTVSADERKDDADLLRFYANESTLDPMEKFFAASLVQRHINFGTITQDYADKGYTMMQLADLIAMGDTV